MAIKLLCDWIDRKKGDVFNSDPRHEDEMVRRGFAIYYDPNDLVFVIKDSNRVEEPWISLKETS